MPTHSQARMRIGIGAVGIALLALPLTAPDSGAAYAESVAGSKSGIVHSTVADVPFTEPASSGFPGTDPMTTVPDTSFAPTVPSDEAAPWGSAPPHSTGGDTSQSGTRSALGGPEEPIDASTVTKRPDAKTTAGDVGMDVGLGIAGGVVGALGGSALAATIACGVGLLYVVVGCPIFVPPAIVAGAVVGGRAGAETGANYRRDKERTAALGTSARATAESTPQLGSGSTGSTASEESEPAPTTLPQLPRGRTDVEPLPAPTGLGDGTSAREAGTSAREGASTTGVPDALTAIGDAIDSIGRELSQAPR